MWVDKEKRLYEVEEFKQILNKFSELEIKKEVVFIYKRSSTLKRIIQLAINHHYSTFCFYNPDEFKTCMGRFIKNLKQEFPDFDHITWQDENILYVINKQ